MKTTKTTIKAVKKDNGASKVPPAKKITLPEKTPEKVAEKPVAKTPPPAPVAPAATVEPIAPLAAVKRSKTAGPAPTVINANIDVGFGNALYVRGEGPGLAWDRGQPMDCVKDDIWSYVIAAAGKPVIFKFLINDETWCAGDDYVVEPGKTITLVPIF